MVFGGCGWPSSANVGLMVRPSFTLMKSAPNSASDADDSTEGKDYTIECDGLSIFGDWTKEEMARWTALGVICRKVGFIWIDV